VVRSAAVVQHCVACAPLTQAKRGSRPTAAAAQVQAFEAARLPMVSGTRLLRIIDAQAADEAAMARNCFQRPEPSSHMVSRYPW
jgi:hypothetical protein